MEFIKELDGVCYAIGGPHMHAIIYVYYDKYHPVTLEDFNNGKFLEYFIELEGHAIDTDLAMKLSWLREDIKMYIAAEDLYLMLPSGKIVPQIELEYEYDI